MNGWVGRWVGVWVVCLGFVGEWVHGCMDAWMAPIGCIGPWVHIGAHALVHSRGLGLSVDWWIGG